jgi:PAS domain-containing protein
METGSYTHDPAASANRLEILVREVATGQTDFSELVGSLMPMIRGDAQLPPEIALQLSTTLIEIEGDAAREDQLYALVNDHDSPAIALSEAGQILALNTAAADLFAISPATDSTHSPFRGRSSRCSSGASPRSRDRPSSAPIYREHVPGHR